MKAKISSFLVLCILGGFAIFSSTMAKNPVLPLFIRSLGVPISTVGFIAAASTVVGIIVSIPAGALSDRIDRRRIILIAAIIFATAPFLYLLVRSPWQLVLVRIYHGMATAILGPVAMAAVADTVDTKRGERLAWYSSATMIGRFLAPLVGGILIFGTDYRWVYLADGFAGALALLAAIKLLLSNKNAHSIERTQKSGQNNTGSNVKIILHNHTIMATSGIEAVQYFAYGSLETFLPIYLNEQMGLAAFEIGLLFTVQILAATLTKPIMGRISDRYGRIPMISAGLTLGGATMITMLYSGNYVILIILIGLFGLGLATVTASTAALVADSAREYNRGSAMGILSSIMDIGHSTGPMVSGLLIGALSYRRTFVLVGSGLILISLIFGLIMRRTVTNDKMRNGKVIAL